MPVLKDAKRERFAQEVAKGKTQLEAHKIAGYKPNEGNAGTLANRPDVSARIRELNSRGAARAEVTIESIYRELEEARGLARQTKQSSAMVSATMGKAKIARLLDDVTKHVGADGGAIKHSIEVCFVDAPEQE